MIKLKQLPTSVKLFVERCDAFIVGSAASLEAEIDGPNAISDIDVIIPFHNWNIACLIIQNAISKSQLCTPVPKLNVYGGIKFLDVDGSQSRFTIDVWPSDLNKFMTSRIPEFLWNPKYDLRYFRYENG